MVEIKKESTEINGKRKFAKWPKEDRVKCLELKQQNPKRRAEDSLVVMLNGSSLRTKRRR